MEVVVTRNNMHVQNAESQNNFFEKQAHRQADGLNNICII
jgi:hypothetical protein